MNDYFVHESSYIDDDVEIGDGTKIWFFCHIQKGARIGKGCSLGQNVNVANNVKIFLRDISNSTGGILLVCTTAFLLSPLA